MCSSVKKLFAGFSLVPALVLCLAMATQYGAIVSANPIQEFTVKASFDGKTVSPEDDIELTLNRLPSAAEGRIALMIGKTDLTDLFVVSGTSFKFSLKAFPLADGDTTVTVHLCDPDGVWKQIASFTLKVSSKPAPTTPTVAENAAPTNPSTSPAANPAANAEAQATTQPAAEPAKGRFGFDKFELAPSLNIGFKSQFAETHFPESNKPERPTFADATLQGTWKSEMARGTFSMQHQFDIVGSSFRNEALRFAEQGEKARRIELSSYLMQFQQGTRKLSIGHSSFGTQRHLINSFASRGFNAFTPITDHFDVSLVAMNSTNVVGFDNFFGVDNERHRLFGGIVGLEVFSKRPGALRFETGAVDAWFLANRQNFNQGNINDSERSKGGSFRILAKDKSERLRFDGGFTRSQFFNPNDPLLNQGAANVIQSTVTTRNARYAEGSVDLLKDHSFVKAKPATTPTASGEAATQTAQTTDAQAVTLPDPKKLNLTLNVKHERVDPLFKSIGAAAQPDLNQNIVEIVGLFGELTFTGSHTQFNDNLAGIRTILRTNTRRETFAINTPTQNLFRQRPAVTPNVWLPRIGYTFERTQATADFIPIGGGFDQPGAIPDQANTNQSITAEWQLTEKYRASYRLNHTLQDNRATGRERADLQNFVHTASFGFTPMPTLELSFDLNFEDANNREQANTNRTMRLGFVANWQATTRQALNVTFATLGAGDLLRTTNSRNDEFDAQWNYKLTRESENKFKKVQMIYFIRYSNRFARTNNFVERINNLTKLNTFNTGLNFIFF